MMRRSCLSWVVAALVGAVLAIPASAQDAVSQQYKDKVLALSKRIDELIAAKWMEAGLKPVAAADDANFFRRMHLDLVGRIPNLTDSRDFVENDDPNKRWEFVEQLLNDKSYRDREKKHGAYADHFANIWRATVLGNTTQAQAQGFMPSFELWLRDHMNRNTPYDKMVRELLTSQNNPNLGFNGQNASPQAFFFANENKAETLAGAVSRTFLGVKLECAQCHKHPFAQWTREQFWEFAAFFNPNQRVFRGQFQPNGGVGAGVGSREIMIPGTKKTVKAKFLTGEEPKWKDADNSLNVVAEWVTSPKNPYFAKAAVDHVWSYFFGITILEPIQEASDDVPVTHPELLDELAKHFAASNYDLKFLIRAIVHTQAYQRASVSKDKAGRDDFYYFTRMPVRGLTPEQIFDSYAEATGHESRGGGNQMFQPGFGPINERQQFLLKFQSQDKRIDTQTSILQALFLMNSKFMAERTKLDNNPDLQKLADQKTSTVRKLESLFLMVLSRLPRQEEVERLGRYIDSGGATSDPRRALGDVYWALLNSAEFMLNH